MFFHIGASIGALSAIMDSGQTSGSSVTGIIIAVAGHATGFLKSFLLAPTFTIAFSV